MVYDLIIVGGGMSGISVAHYFRNQKILILERANLLSGATGHNAGFIISGFGEHYLRTVSRNGRDRARQIQQIHLQSHQKIRELAEQINCDYNHTGSLTISRDETEFHELKRSFELLKGDGFKVDWVDSVDVGLKDFSGALLNHDDGVIDSSHFWSSLAVNIPSQIQCEVHKIVQKPSTIQLVTSAGSFESEKVVFCLNAFSASLLPELAGLYIQLRGQMLQLSLKMNAPTSRPIIMNYGDIYWRFAGGHLNFGGLEYRVPEDEIGIATYVSGKIVEEQIAWIQEFMNPQLFSSTQPMHTWCSTMAFTVDGFPFVGPLERERCYVLAGLCGLGHSYAIEGARWLHELIMNKRNIIPDFCSSDRMKSLQRFTGGDWRSQYEAWNHGIH